jgi:hypothetical protein
MGADDTPGGAMEEKPSFADQVRALLDEYQVERRVTELAEQADQLVRQGLSWAGEFAHEHREDVGRLLDRAADAVNGRTEGRHASTVEDVRGVLVRGMDKLTEHRDPADAGDPAESTGPDDSGGPTDPDAPGTSEEH